jgi:SH3 domain protein
MGEASAADRARRGVAVAAAGLVTAALLVAPGGARAEAAWIKEELRLNLRSGPGVQYRIMGVVETGDAVQVMKRGNGWTQVRVADLGDGWIPEGYLQPEPPAAVRLAQSEAQTAEFRSQFESLVEKSSALEAQNKELTQRDTEQRTEIESLTRENMELHAGARWPEWITGAGILGAGMVMGAILHAVTGRRQRPRIRL